MDQPVRSPSIGARTPSRLLPKRQRRRSRHLPTRSRRKHRLPRSHRPLPSRQNLRPKPRPRKLGRLHPSRFHPRRWNPAPRRRATKQANPRRQVLLLQSRKNRRHLPRQQSSQHPSRPSQRRRWNQLKRSSRPSQRHRWNQPKRPRRLQRRLNRNLHRLRIKPALKPRMPQNPKFPLNLLPNLKRRLLRRILRLPQSLSRPRRQKQLSPMPPLRRPNPKFLPSRRQIRSQRPRFRLSRRCLRWLTRNGGYCSFKARKLSFNRPIVR